MSPYSRTDGNTDCPSPYLLFVGTGKSVLRTFRPRTCKKLDGVWYGVPVPALFSSTHLLSPILAGRGASFGKPNQKHICHRSTLHDMAHLSSAMKQESDRISSQEIESLNETSALHSLVPSAIHSVRARNAFMDWLCIAPAQAIRVGGPI